MSETSALLLLPRLRVQNANAICGPLSWGFPPPSAFTGFTHALERRLRGSIETKFGGVAIICHRFEPLISQPAGRRHQVLCLTRNPVIAGWKKYEDNVASIVEEGRAHLEISLLIESYTDLDEGEQKALMQVLIPTLFSMRLAGGSILPAYNDLRRMPVWIEWPETAVEQRDAFRKFRRRLLPGFALVQQEEVLIERLTELRQTDEKADALDALLDLCRLNYEPMEPDAQQPDKARWELRRQPGWLVPLAVGYGALSPLYPPGIVKNVRDPTIPFRFVESLYTIGQWISPHRLNDIEQLFWRQHADPETGIYRCINRFTQSEPIA